MTEDEVRNIFRGLEKGNGGAFFNHVASNVDWTVMGTHPLAGHYRSKQAFIAGTFEKLAKVLPHGAQLSVDHVLVCGDKAAVELRSNATAKNGCDLTIAIAGWSHFPPASSSKYGPISIAL